MVEHDHAIRGEIWWLTDTGVAVLDALDALDAAAEREAAPPIDFYPTDERVDDDAHGS